MKLYNHLPHRSIFKCRYSVSREETKFPTGIKTSFGKINLCTQTVTVLKAYLRKREGSVFSARGRKRQDNKKWADGVNFQSCVWESSIQIPLTNIGVGGSDSYSPGFKNNRFPFLQLHLLLTHPWRRPGSSLTGWHLCSSTGPNVSLHLGQGSSPSKQKWKYMKYRSELMYVPRVLMDVLWRRTKNVRWLHPTTRNKPHISLVQILLIVILYSFRTNEGWKPGRYSRYGCSVMFQALLNNVWLFTSTLQPLNHKKCTVQADAMTSASKYI